LTSARGCVYCTLTMTTGSTHRIRVLAVLAAAAMAAVPVRLRADLAQASPFLPANAVAAGAPGGPSGPIELRGIMATSDGTQYCIYDVAKKKDAWVGLNEEGHDFVVKTADPNADRVSVEYEGRILHLDLHASKVVSSGTGALAPPIAAAPGLPNPTPADEQKRLDAVAQEVRRRRQERERAMQDASGNPAPAPGAAGSSR